MWNRESRTTYLCSFHFSKLFFNTSVFNTAIKALDYDSVIWPHAHYSCCVNPGTELHIIFQLYILHHLSMMIISQKFVVKSNRLWWVGHVAWMGESGNRCRIMLGRPVENGALGWLWRRWKDDFMIENIFWGWEPDGN